MKPLFHISGRSIAAIAAILASLALAAPASALEKGVQTDLTWGISGSDQDRTMAGVTDVGAGWVRLTLAWHDVETSNNSYSGSELRRYDTAINKANAAGVKILVAIHSSPNWASGTSMREAPPLNPADFADFMSYIANRYRGTVDAWELWNEPNTQTFWPTGENPAHFAAMIKAAGPAVRAADPAAKVVYGGTWNNDIEFLEAVYAAEPNIGDYFDVLGTHPYAGNTDPRSIEFHNGRLAFWVFASYRELRETMLAHGDDKPIWFTEFGWSSYNGDWGVSEAVQAEYLSAAYRCAEQDPYVEVAFWYAFRNHHQGGDAQSWEQQLGLTRTDFSQKPAYSAFKSYTSGSGGCSYWYPEPPSVPEPPPLPEPEPEPTPEPTPEPAPEPTPEPAPEPAPTEEEPAGEADEPVEKSESSTVTGSGRPEVRVRIVRFRRAQTAGVRMRRTRTVVAIVGRVKRADRGRVVLRLQRRGGHGNWRRAGRFELDVRRTGRFRKRIKLDSGRWRVRAVYRAASSPKTRSRLVYFRG